MEYIDPRTKRKYYYSATTKKSTWTKPYNFDSIRNQSNMTINNTAYNSNNNTSSSSNKNNNMNSNSRYESPNVSIRSNNRREDLLLGNAKLTTSQQQQYANPQTNTTPLRLEELDVYDPPVSSSGSLSTSFQSYQNNHNASNATTPSSINQSATMTADQYNSMYFATRGKLHPTMSTLLFIQIP